MGIFIVIFSIVWAGIGVFIKKYPETMAGYNTMSPERRKNVDIRAVGTLMCRGFGVMAVSMVVLYFALRLWGQPLRIAILGLFVPIFTGTATLLVMVRRYDKNRWSGLKYYLSAGILLLIFTVVVCAFIY